MVVSLPPSMAQCTRCVSSIYDAILTGFIRSRLFLGAIHRLPYQVTTCVSGLHQFGASSPKAVKAAFFCAFFLLVQHFLRGRQSARGKAVAFKARKDYNSLNEVNRA